MRVPFRDRTDAGEQLAGLLREYADRSDVLVLGLPRGGVPVAAVVARELHAPLDVFVVRKLGVPEYPELAMGAIASGGATALNADVIRSLGISERAFEEVVRREQEELKRRERTYRDGLPPLAVAGKTVILVDDGIATGSTMTAAISGLRQLGAGKIVVATPVIAPSTERNIALVTDKLVAVLVPDEFYGVGGFYGDFSQTTDAEVRDLFAEGDRRTSPAAN